jgi:hypothetical protein
LSAAACSVTWSPHSPDLEKMDFNGTTFRKHKFRAVSYWSGEFNISNIHTSSFSCNIFYISLEHNLHIRCYISWAERGENDTYKHAGLTGKKLIRPMVKKYVSEYFICSFLDRICFSLLVFCTVNIRVKKMVELTHLMPLPFIHASLQDE